jgi:hypothetical protein
MFTNGFNKRDVNINNPVFRYIAGRQNAPDIVPKSAVCVTRHFEAAPLFPVSDLLTPSWVYVLDLDTADMTNTQQSQYVYVQQVGRLGVAGALWPMFGQERAVNSVAPGDIVGAVYVTRRFNGNDVFNGGSFLPSNYQANPGYLGGNAALVANLINGLVAAGNWIDMPTQAQGIVQSTFT